MVRPLNPQGKSLPGTPDPQKAADETARQMQAGSFGQGIFNFQDIMKKFYEWEPKEDDVAGQQLKNTFQGDFIQTVLNNQMSKDLAYTNAEIATGQMTTAAALELANQTQIMKDEFDMGMQKMGAEYDYQTKFASDSSNIKMNEMALSADLTKNQTILEGDQNRLNIAAQGVNDLNLQDTKNRGALEQIGAQGSIDTKIQDMKGQQAVEQIGAQGDVDIANIGAQGVEAIKQIEAQGYLDYQLQGLKGDQALSQIGAQGDVDISKIKETGTQERLGMEQATKEDTKKQKRDSGMARSLAGMF